MKSQVIEPNIVPVMLLHILWAPLPNVDPRSDFVMPKKTSTKVPIRVARNAWKLTLE
eukprot:CAMPEP_0184305912 /NCGR_PEP_ID=MMETSP1049-20130417/15054_1 /TAXON_ID=77928 /ORGANISM="Proteomonas sulcata, Strain CCMP704" /LENGTH=56 /DNA_ID=CAMNT_0026618067 /DNA_START=920 /DNA_END=1090 /DNA_ORIENTATION=-